VKTLVDIYHLYQADQPDLQRPYFVAVRKKLPAYFITISSVRASADPNSGDREAYEKTLDQLAGELTIYQKEPTPRGLEMIRSKILWLEDSHEARELLDALRAHFPLSD
jgi:hypothetical protein